MFEKKFYILFSLVLIFTTSCQINIKNNLNEDYLLLNYSFDKEQTIIKVGGEYTVNNKGETNKALKLNGVDEFVIIKNSPKLKVEDEITLSIWIKPENFIGQGNNSIISKGNSKHEYPFYQYHLGIDGSKSKATNKQFTFSLTISGDTHTLKTKNNFWEAGNWYNLIGVYNGKAIKFYINSKLISEKKGIHGKITQFDTPICIGNFSNNINFYTPGTFDDLKIYNKGFSELKIKEMYAAKN